ncbi:MAG: PIN domain-containing protein [Candidatus Rokubacteria bacterium]|nr:PIN domain-containing protein [Candidatus Rokubacteria bacterium]
MRLPRRVFCDTSFFYACFNPDDANHARAEELVAEAVASGTAFTATWDIISETVTLLRYRRNFQAALAFLNEVKPQLHIVRYGDRVRDEAEQVFRQYGRERRLSFCDAVSFVVVTTLLDHMPCLAFDEDFRGLGLTVVV